MDPTANGNRHIVSHVFNVSVMVICVAALAWMMHKLGWTQARAVVSDVGPWLGLILALDLVALCCDAASIHAFLGSDAHLISFWRVLAATLVNRARSVTLALLGLSVMAITHTVNRVSISRRRRRLHRAGPAAASNAAPRPAA